MKKTKWFPADIKPVRIGIYEVLGSNHMWLWDGANWRSSGPSRFLCQGQWKIWRGLASDPNKVKK
jgi:hypothetical protein